MGRRIAIIVLVLLMAALVIGWQSFLNQTVAVMSDYSEAIYAAAMNGDNQQAMTLSTRLNEYWDACSSVIHSMVDHTLSEHIQTLISECSMLAYTGSDELPMKAAELDFKVKHLKESEAFLLKNIL